MLWLIFLKDICTNILDAVWLNAMSSNQSKLNSFFKNKKYIKRSRLDTYTQEALANPTGVGVRLRMQD